MGGKKMNTHSVIGWYTVLNHIILDTQVYLTKKKKQLQKSTFSIRARQRIIFLSYFIISHSPSFQDIYYYI